MSNAINMAIAKEQQKLIRQEENHESTKALLAVLGDDVKELNKLERQKEAIKETKQRIARLEKARKG